MQQKRWKAKLKFDKDVNKNVSKFFH